MHIIFRGRKYYEPISQSTVSKISNSIGKIKGALRTNQPIEGAIYTPEIQTIENGIVEDIIAIDCNVDRDLSTWSVSIPSIDTMQVWKSNTVESQPICCSRNNHEKSLLNRYFCEQISILYYK